MDFIFKFKPSTELVTFLCVGCFITLLNYACFAGLYLWLNTHYLMASAVGFVCGAVCGYYLNKKLTFKDTKSFSFKVFLSYIAVNVISLILSLIVLKILVTIGINPLVANVLCIGFSATTNYLGIKNFVFKK